MFKQTSDLRFQVKSLNYHNLFFKCFGMHQVTCDIIKHTFQQDSHQSKGMSNSKIT